jgi:hypothetical protein
MAARAGRIGRDPATTVARRKPPITWNRNRGPMVGMCLYPICQRCRWTSADRATSTAPISIEQGAATRRAFSDGWSVAADTSPLTAEEIVDAIRCFRPRHWDLRCCPRLGRPHRSAEWGSMEEQAPSWLAA